MTNDSTDDIMRATYRALCAHGYAGVTMQRIADESTKSKAALHYHYGSKHDLLVAFLEHLYADFEGRVTDPDGDDPVARLFTLLETLLTPPERDDQREFATALLEIKSQAPYDDAYREHLLEFDRLVHEEVSSVVTEGIEQGVFEPVDADELADFVVTVLNGVQTRHVVGGPSLDARRALLDYIETTLLTGEHGPEETLEVRT